MQTKAQTKEKNYERGARIADRRKALGLSQDELAHRIGIGRQSLSAIENGGSFRAQTLDSLAVELEVSADFIMYGAGSTKAELVAEAVKVLSDMDEMEKYYTDLLKMPAVKSSRNPDGDKLITAATVHQIHKVLRSCFRQAVKWDMMDKNPATDATLPKYKAEEREIWTAEMLMQAIDACENKWLKVAFHLAFAATVRLGELLGLTWDCVDISEEAISENRAYVFINKQVERVSKEAVEELDSKEVILIFPSQRKNNKTVRVLKTPKTDTSERKVYIPGFVAQCLIDIKKEQDEVKEALGSEYTDYNLIMATTFGMPINGSYIRDQMQKVIDKEGLPDVVFHSLRHTSVTYKLKLSGGDIKAVQGDSGHAQADMVTEVYDHIIDEDRRKNAERMENAFYNKENLNPDIHEQKEEENKITILEGVDPELLMKVLSNPEMAALLTSLAKTMKV